MSTVIDERAPGCTLTGNGVDGWFPFGTGYNGGINYSAAGDGTVKAKWSFTGLTAGHNYKIALTWVQDPNRATNVPWTILDSNGITVLLSGTINQVVAPSGFSIPDELSTSITFQTLTLVAIPTGTSLAVQITNAGNGFVIADAAYLEDLGIPVTPPAAPSDLAVASVTSSSVNLTWTDNANNETGFVVRYIDQQNYIDNGNSWNGPALPVLVPLNTGDLQSTNIITLAPNRTYRFGIKATNSGGDSAWSNDATGTTLSATVSLHIATLQEVSVLSGVVKPKSQMTIGESLQASREIRIAPDSSNPNTANYPTIKAYLIAEAAQNYKLLKMNRQSIITQS